jgi:hypothetical protein
VAAIMHVTPDVSNNSLARTWCPAQMRGRDHQLEIAGPASRGTI